MGVSVSLINAFFCTEWPSAPITDTHGALTQAGLESAPDRPPETVRYRSSEGGVSEPTDGTIAEFADIVDAAGEGRLLYQYDSQQIRATFRSESATDDRPWPVGLGGPDGDWFDPNVHGEQTVADRLDTISDAFVRIANRIDPDFGYLMLFNDHGWAEALPKSHVPADHGIERLPYLLLLGESWIEYCGGRSHVLETPVYARQTLDTGSIVLRTKEQITPHGCGYTTGYDHLLGQYDILNDVDPEESIYFVYLDNGAGWYTVEERIEPFGDGNGHLRCQTEGETVHITEVADTADDRVAIERDGEVRHTARYVNTRM